MAPREPRPDFERLYRSHRSEVYRVALRKLGDHHDAEDVTQAAFLDAYRAVLRGSKPDLPRAWLLAIAENVRRRRFRTALRRPREEPLGDESLPSAEPPWRAQTEEIRAALATLAENQRKVFLLRELGGFSYSEIAAQLDLSVPAVQMLLFRARQKLRAELGSGTARIGGLIPIPHWLLGLADRVPTGFAGPRVAGLVAAGVIATGVGVVSDVSVAEPKRQPAGHAPLVVSKPVARHVTAPVVSAAPVSAAVAAKRGVEAASAKRRSAHPLPTAPVVEAVEVVEDGGAEPAAPVAPSATLGIGDGTPAPALVPTLPSVSQAPIVSVVTTHLPPLPVPPVDVVVPALPDLPIVQPSLPPALPDGTEVTIPGVVGIQVGP
jgi:RNA polymerase sigma-70 factor, ECF subfamily